MNSPPVEVFVAVPVSTPCAAEGYRCRRWRDQHYYELERCLILLFAPPPVSALHLRVAWPTAAVWCCSNRGENENLTARRPRPAGATISDHRYNHYYC